MSNQQEAIGFLKKVWSELMSLPVFNRSGHSQLEKEISYFEMEIKNNQILFRQW